MPRCGRAGPVRRWVLVAVAVAVTVASTSTACGGPSAKPLVALLSAAPTPSAGVLVVAESTDGTIEIGARARLVYSVPAPLRQACALVIAQYRTAHYTVTTDTGYLPDDDVITDDQAYCTRMPTGQAIPTISFNAYEPKARKRDRKYGFSVLLRAADATDPFPAGSRLQLSNL